jgi:threonylcarbamoyladenosine tRNA methylthiotransferase MtaB
MIIQDVGGDRLRDKLRREAGRRRLILVEGHGIGRTEHYFPVAMPGAPRGAIVPAVLALTDANSLTGQILAEAA